MENMLYFAVFGKQTENKRKNTGYVYGGFGFMPDGKLRIPYPLPANSAILFDDRSIPPNASVLPLQEFVEAQQVHTVVFDFEKPKNKLLCDIISSLRVREKYFPVQYSGLIDTGVFLKPYIPKVSFSAYLHNAQKHCGMPLLDLQPINCAVCRGQWKQRKTEEFCSGRYSEANRCMYLTTSGQAGTEIIFYDTQKTVLARAAASGLPCLLPLAEFESLPEG